MTSRAGTGVSILEGVDTTLSPSNKGNVYLNDNQVHGDVPYAHRPRTDVRVQWIADTVLVIRQHPTVHVVFAAIKFAGVTVEYDTLP